MAVASLTLTACTIGWAPDQDPAVMAGLREAGVTHVEFAPTRLWPDLGSVRSAQARAERRRWEQAGLQVSSFQSVLFGRPDLLVFGTPGQRADLVLHLEAVLDLAQEMGATRVVFGSPRNRVRGELLPERAEQIAVDLFGVLGEASVRRGTVLCLEPNPVEYGTDSWTTAGQAAGLVRQVDSPGFRLHLDLACARLAGDDFAGAVREWVSLLAHVHWSRPQLGPVRDLSCEDWDGWAALTESGYSGFVGLEQRTTANAVEDMAVAIRLMRSLQAGRAVRPTGA